MRRVEVKYADEGHESGLEFPDAFALTQDPHEVEVPSATVEETMDTIREEIIAALDQRRPPVIFLPRGLRLTVYETVKTINEDDDDDD